MNYIDHIDTFDAYLNGEMTAEKKAEFESQLATDSELRALLQEHKMLIAALQGSAAASDAEFEEAMRNISPDEMKKIASKKHVSLPPAAEKPASTKSNWAKWLVAAANVGVVTTAGLKFLPASDSTQATSQTRGDAPTLQTDANDLLNYNAEEDPTMVKAKELMNLEPGDATPKDIKKDIKKKASQEAIQLLKKKYDSLSADSLNVTDNILRKCEYGKLLVNAYIATGEYREYWEAQKLAEEIIGIQHNNGLARDFDLESKITLLKIINPKRNDCL